MPAKKTTTQKGLGHSHKLTVKGLKAKHADGTPCWWCGLPMYVDKSLNWDGESLAGDHSMARAHHRGTKADRLLHGWCNKSRGSGERDHLRPTLTGIPVGQKSTATDDRSNWCVLDW